LPQFDAFPLGLGIHIQPARAIFDLAVKQFVQQHVAARQIIAVVGVDPVLQQRGTCHAEFPRHRSGLPHMVRLHGALGHNVAGALCLGLTDQPFQLADLVPLPSPRPCSRRA